MTLKLFLVVFSCLACGIQGALDPLQKPEEPAGAVQGAKSLQDCDKGVLKVEVRLPQEKRNPVYNIHEDAYNYEEIITRLKTAKKKNQYYPEDQETQGTNYKGIVVEEKGNPDSKMLFIGGDTAALQFALYLHMPVNDVKNVDPHKVGLWIGESDVPNKNKVKRAATEFFAGFLDSNKQRSHKPGASVATNKDAAGKKKL